MFSIESKFYRLTIYIYHLVLVNLLFIVTSLLIVSLPASFLSLTKTLQSVERPGIVKTYFDCFKENFFKALPLGIFNLCSLLFTLSIQTIYIDSSLFFRLVIYVFLFFLFSYNINLYFVFGLVEGKIKYYTVFQQSFIWSLGNFYQNSILLIVTAVVLLYFFFEVPLVLSLCGVSLPTLIYTRLFDYKVLKMKKG